MEQPDNQVQHSKASGREAVTILQGLVRVSIAGNVRVARTGK